MKCITNGSKCLRVSDAKADQLVDQGYRYMNKRDWKKASGRVREEDEPVVKAPKKDKKPKGKKAEKAAAKAEKAAEAAK